MEAAVKGVFVMLVSPKATLCTYSSEYYTAVTRIGLLLVI